MLSEADQRRFIMLLCLRCCNGDETLHETAIAFQLRISVEDWRKTREKFLMLGLITKDNKPAKWDVRQYKSDTSTARVRSFRKRSRNVAVTPPDTDSDTDTEKVKTIVRVASDDPADFSQFWRSYPRKEGKKKTLSRWKHMDAEAKQQALAGLKRWQDSGRWDDPQFIPQPLTYLNGERWKDEIAKTNGRKFETYDERTVRESRANIDGVVERHTKNMGRSVQ